MNEDVTNLMRHAITPLRPYDVTNTMPTLPSVISAYGKMRESCLWDTETPDSDCLSSQGKWMKVVLRVLQVAADIIKALREEASVVLVEDTDSLFNPVLSALVQVILDPKRRTVQGFESLMSKEFMALNGFSNRLEAIRFPEPVLFVLFLDCVWQLLHENGDHFEFTSLYLIRMFDFQYLPSSLGSSNRLSNNFGETSYRKELPSKTRPFSPFLHQLSVNQLMFHFNPLYESSDRTRPVSNLRIPSKIIELTFFGPLYLRWDRLRSQRNYYYNAFPIHEVVYFQLLLASSSSSSDPSPKKEGHRVDDRF
jgi:hypothetical protein